MKMKRFPLFRQLNMTDCGCCCLQMIASFYNKTFPIDIIQNKIFAGKDGVSLKGISYAAEEIGFKTVGGLINITNLNTKITLPCILHWDQIHFVVLFKIEKKKNDYIYHIADPAKGVLKYKFEEFSSYWISTTEKGEEKGVVLLLEPTHKFYENQQENEKKKKNTKLSFLFGYLSKYKKYFFQIIWGLLLGSLLQLSFPFLTQAIVDKGIGNKDLNFIWVILLAQMMLLLGRFSINFIQRRILLHISARINISLISDFFIKLLNLPMRFFDTKLIGDLLQRIDDHKRIEQFLTSHSLNILFSVFTFFIFGIVLLIYNLKIFLIFIAFSILYIGWMMIFLKKRRKLDYKLFEQMSINRSKTYQLINGVQEIKLQGCEQRKRWEWEDSQADLFETNLEFLSFQQKQEAGSFLINEAKNIIVTILSATSVIQGDITLGMMLSIQYIIGQLNSPIEQIMNFVYRWQDVAISLDRMNEIHCLDNEESKNRNTKHLDNNNIKINNLTFHYEGPTSKKVLNKLNFEIPARKITAIVGASGSGKTTLIKLLLGYYSPTKGHIYISNQSLETFNLKWWRSQCGAVMQDGFIFSDTIARNIVISEDEIDIERLHYSAELAQIHDYIINLPLGYNTIIGEEGQGLSQGQMQRLLIARIIYKNPPFVFLDEATNALDANNEKVILENLEQFYKDKTVILIAHRLSTVKNADQIIVLENGKIVEQGNHETLTNIRGKYFHLVKNQLELGN